MRKSSMPDSRILSDFCFKRLKAFTPFRERLIKSFVHIVPPDFSAIYSVIPNNQNKKTKRSRAAPKCQIKCYQTALVTLPERRQRVQALIRFGVPLTIALTRCTFGFHVLFERLCEWETLMPKATSLPQISHFAMCLHLLDAD